jgi:hypothetical protein
MDPTPELPEIPGEDKIGEGVLLGEGEVMPVPWQTTALYTAPLGALYGGTTYILNTIRVPLLPYTDITLGSTPPVLGVTNILEYVIIEDSSGSVFMILHVHVHI